MSKRQKKKASAVEEDLEVEVINRVEYPYEDTKFRIGVEPEYQWGKIYRLIMRREVPDIGFEEENIYANIERSSLMKIATRPKLFPCSEVIGWILPRVDVTTMILENVDKQSYATYSPGYVALAYHFPEAQIYLTEDWVKSIRMDLVETLKRMLMPGKNFRTRTTREYDMESIRTPYRFITLMLNRIFGRAHSKRFKLEWVLIIFYVAT